MYPETGVNACYQLKICAYSLVSFLGLQIGAEKVQALVHRALSVK